MNRNAQRADVKGKSSRVHCIVDGVANLVALTQPYRGPRRILFIQLYLTDYSGSVSIAKPNKPFVFYSLPLMDHDYSLVLTTVQQSILWFSPTTRICNSVCWTVGH